MTERTNERRCISRPAALAGTALALGVAAAAMAVPQAAAQQKISHALVKYQGTPNGDRHGEVCDNFQPPDASKFVQGEIGRTVGASWFSPKT